jgi:hypothetical protein
LAVPPPALTSSKSFFGGYLLIPFGLTSFLTYLAVNSLRSFAIFCTSAFAAVAVIAKAAYGFLVAVIEVEFVNKS